jgi:hypothetical protein
LSGCYEQGGERIGAGTGTMATWRRREGAVPSVRHTHKKGPRPAAARAQWRWAAVRHATPSRGVEEGVRSGGPHLEERGGVWAAPGTCGPAEEKGKMGRARRNRRVFNLFK